MEIFCLDTTLCPLTSPVSSTKVPWFFFLLFFLWKAKFCFPNSKKNDKEQFVHWIVYGFYDDVVEKRTPPVSLSLSLSLSLTPRGWSTRKYKNKRAVEFSISSVVYQYVVIRSVQSANPHTLNCDCYSATVTGFTSTKVQILTPEELKRCCTPRRASPQKKGLLLMCVLAV